MATVKAMDLRELDVTELHRKADELAQQLFEVRKKQATGQVDNPARLRELKRDRARVLTVIREKELGV